MVSGYDLIFKNTPTPNLARATRRSPSFGPRQGGRKVLLSRHFLLIMAQNESAVSAISLPLEGRDKGWGCGVSIDTFFAEVVEVAGVCTS
jgi:hypothetical protein